MRLNRLNQLVVDGRKVVEGQWRIAHGHTLEYRGRGDQASVRVSGPIVDASARGLTFRVEEHTLDREVVGRRLTLRGHWQADSRNRLAFVADGQRGQRSWLTLTGVWEVGRRHALLYRIHQDRLKARGDQVRTIRFQGFWDLGDDKRLTYVLDQDSESAFRFRGTFQTPSVLAKQGSIRYQVGVEVSGRRRVQTVTLFGIWKLSRKLELTLEVPYQDGQTRGIAFGADFRVEPNRKVTVALLDQKGRALGLELVASHSFLKSRGEAFVRLSGSLSKLGLEAGVRFPWG